MVRKEVTQLASRGFLGIMAVSCLLLATVSASGQTEGSGPLISNTIGLGPQVGWHKCDDADHAAAYLSVVSRIRIASIMALEGVVGYIGDERFDWQHQTGLDLAATVHRFPVTGSLLVYAPIARQVMPYVLGGVGAHYMVLDYSQYINDNIVADQSKIRFGYHLGFGLEIALNEHLALHGDYRYLYVDNAFEKELQFDFSSTSYQTHTVAAGFVAYF